MESSQKFNGIPNTDSVKSIKNKFSAKYLQETCDNYVDIRHNNRLILVSIGMLFVMIILVGLIWLWNAPKDQQIIIKIILTIPVIILSLYLFQYILQLSNTKIFIFQ